MSSAAPSAAARPVRTPRIFHHSGWDAILVLLAIGQGVLLLRFPTVLTIGVGLWWNSNTISHHFIHNPFFRARTLNRVFAGYLSVLLGFPHDLWRTRHLAHHADSQHRLKWTRGLCWQTALAASVWCVLCVWDLSFVLTVYLPGWLLGMGLCVLQGRYEHIRGTVSCYGPVYNVLFFNDGLHVEHHAHPRRHWTQMRRAESRTEWSRWPPVFRWLDSVSLEGLERVVLRSPWLQRWVVRTHARAFSRLLTPLEPVQRVGIVGGGLFPRTAVILRDQLPDADLTVIDFSRASLQAATNHLPQHVETKEEAFDRSRHGDFDLLVFPLALQGAREPLYSDPPATYVLVHDWLWRRRGKTAVVSWLLLKRLNLVSR